jgi:hypothetical protein
MLSAVPALWLLTCAYSAPILVSSEQRSLSRGQLAARTEIASGRTEPKGQKQVRAFKATLTLEDEMINRLPPLLNKPAAEMTNEEVLAYNVWPAHVTIDQARSQIEWEQSEEYAALKSRLEAEKNVSS